MEAMGRPKGLLEEASATESLASGKYRDLRMHRAVNARIVRPEQGKRSDILGPQSVMLLFGGPRSSAIDKKHIPQIGGASARMTITPGGDLQVYMRSINRKRCWNPPVW
jgi:hypothetical protein